MSTTPPTVLELVELDHKNHKRLYLVSCSRKKLKKICLKSEKKCQNKNLTYVEPSVVYGLVWAKPMLPREV